MFLGSGGGGTGHHVDKAVSVVVDEADPFIRSLGSDKHGDTKVILLPDVQSDSYQDCPSDVRIVRKPCYLVDHFQIVACRAVQEI